MMSEAERIAEGLTEAQRRRLLAMKEHDRNYSGYNEGSSYASIKRAGLAYKTAPVRGGWPYYRLTPLGLEVRKVLEASK